MFMFACSNSENSVIYAMSFIHLTNVRGHHTQTQVALHKMSMKFQLFFELTQFMTEVWIQNLTQPDEHQRFRHLVLINSQFIFHFGCNNS